MPLIECPDCTKQISDLAPSCINCGRPMKPVNPENTIVDAAENIATAVAANAVKNKIQESIDEELGASRFPFSLSGLIYKAYDDFTTHVSGLEWTLQIVAVFFTMIGLTIALRIIFRDTEFVSSVVTIINAFIFLTVSYKITQKREKLKKIGEKLSNGETWDFESKDFKGLLHFSDLVEELTKSFLCKSCGKIFLRSNFCPSCSEELKNIERVEAFEIANSKLGRPFLSYSDFLMEEVKTKKEYWSIPQLVLLGIVIFLIISQIISTTIKMSY